MRYRGNNIWQDERTNEWTGERTGQANNIMPLSTMSGSESIKIITAKILLQPANRTVLDNTVNKYTNNIKYTLHTCIH